MDKKKKTTNAGVLFMLSTVTLSISLSEKIAIIKSITITASVIFFAIGVVFFVKKSFKTKE